MSTPAPSTPSSSAPATAATWAISLRSPAALPQLGLLHPVVVTSGRATRRWRAPPGGMPMLGWADDPGYGRRSRCGRARRACRERRPQGLPAERDRGHPAGAGAARGEGGERQRHGDGNDPVESFHQVREAARPATRSAPSPESPGATSRRSPTSSRPPRPSPRSSASSLADMDRTGRVNGLLQAALQVMPAGRADPSRAAAAARRALTASSSPIRPGPTSCASEDPSHRGTIRIRTMSIAEICALPVRALAHDDFDPLALDDESSHAARRSMLSTPGGLNRRRS